MRVNPFFLTLALANTKIEQPKGLLTEPAYTPEEPGEREARRLELWAAFHGKRIWALRKAPHLWERQDGARIQVNFSLASIGGRVFELLPVGAFRVCLDLEPVKRRALILYMDLTYPITGASDDQATVAITPPSPCERDIVAAGDRTQERE